MDSKQCPAEARSNDGSSGHEGPHSSYLKTPCSVFLMLLSKTAPTLGNRLPDGWYAKGARAMDAVLMHMHRSTNRHMGSILMKLPSERAGRVSGVYLKCSVETAIR